MINMDIKRLGVTDLENLIRKYINDAAAMAEGAPFHKLNCSLDGIKTPKELSSAIKTAGDAYLKKMAALRNATPTVRGDTISIFGPKPEIPANTPSREDEMFLIYCRRHLLENGYVYAADADTYEKIVKKYPDHARPARVRGAEARRWIGLHAFDVVTKRIKKR